MNIDKTKLVTWRSLVLGQEIKGYRSGGQTRYFKAFIESANVATVIFKLWDKDGAIDTVSSEGTMFMVKMSDVELENKWRDKAKDCLSAMKNKLSVDEIGYHEMWNGWLFGSPYEIAAECEKTKIKIAGHCEDIIPKTAMFSGDTLDIGVCAEYEDGERFWCHFRSKDLANMESEFADLV